MRGIAGSATGLAALSLWLVLYIAPCTVAYTYEYGWYITNSTCSGGTSCKKCVERGCSYFKCSKRRRSKKSKTTTKNICGTPSRYQGGSTDPPGFEDYTCSEDATQGECKKTRGTGLIVGGCIFGFIGLVMLCVLKDIFCGKRTGAADTGAPKEEQLSVQPVDYGTADVALETHNPVLITDAGSPPVDDISTKALVDSDAGAIQVNEATTVEPSATPSTNNEGQGVCGMCVLFTLLSGFLGGSIAMLYLGVKMRQSAD